MRDRLTDGLSFLAVLALGLTAGAMLTEAAVLLPFWKTLPAEQFFSWYESNAKLLVAFYSPLEIAGAVLALVAAILNLVSRRPARLWVVASIMSLVVIGFFFVYFKDANAAFANRTVSPNDLPAALVTWGTWQWMRIAVGMVAFMAATAALMRKAAA